MMTNIFFFLLFHGFLLGIVGLFIYPIDFQLSLFRIAHLIVSLIILEYYAYKIHRWYFDYQKRKKELRERITKEIEIVEDFLDDKLNYYDSTELIEVINKIEKYDFHIDIKCKYHSKIKEKMIPAKRLLEKLQHEEEIKELENQKAKTWKELKNLEFLYKNETRTPEEKREELKESMELDENPVFHKEGLYEFEIELLLEEGYRQSNEYSLYSKEVEPFFIKKTMNHSSTHTFLVWDIIRFLEDLDLKKITEHKTIDADITFKHKNKIYAIEVETGTLLKKKKQAQEKVDYLNKKYKDRWLFVVSNRDLLKKYKKLGFSTQRKQFEKTIKKWLKLDT